MIDAPPPPAAVHLIEQAAEYWRVHGVSVPPITVSDEPAQPGALADAELLKDGSVRIRLSKGYLALKRDGQAVVALHETVHAAQRVTHDSYVPVWIEGQAQALAEDHLCPFMARVWNRKVAITSNCQTPYACYPAETAAVRTYSARASRAPWRSATARAWRLNNLRQTSWQRSTL